MSGDPFSDPRFLHHRVLERERREARRAAGVRWPSYGDSLATLLLGTLAMGLGLVALGATLAGIAGIALEPWNQPRDVLTEAKPRQYEWARDPELGREVRRVRMVVATTILVPSPSCVGVALVGAAFGLAGFALALRRLRLSSVSVAGLLSGYFCPIVGAVYEFVMNLLY
jgi:hypothetical protein